MPHFVSSLKKAWEETNDESLWMWRKHLRSKGFFEMDLINTVIQCKRILAVFKFGAKSTLQLTAQQHLANCTNALVLPWPRTSFLIFLVNEDNQSFAFKFWLFVRPKEQVLQKARPSNYNSTESSLQSRTIMSLRSFKRPWMNSRRETSPSQTAEHQKVASLGLKILHTPIAKVFFGGKLSQGVWKGPFTWSQQLGASWCDFFTPNMTLSNYVLWHRATSVLGLCSPELWEIAAAWIIHVHPEEKQLHVPYHDT